MAKILAFLIDFVTLGIGAGVLVGYALNNRDEEWAGVGAAMIVLGLLIREKRAAPKKSVESHGQIAKLEENEIERKARMFDEMNEKVKTPLIIILLSVSTFSLWASNRNNISSHSHPWQFQEIQSRMDNLDGNLNAIDERLEEVEEHSHYHRGY